MDGVPAGDFTATGAETVPEALVPDSEVTAISGSPRRHVPEHAIEARESPEHEIVGGR